jgi:hypothetical protein
VSDLQRWDEEGREGLVPAAVKTAVRGLSVEQLTRVIDYLTPHVTGMMGEVSPKMVDLYRQYIRERALMAGVYAHPPAREPVKEEEVVESTAVDGRVLGEKVLLELERLAKEDDE